MFYFIYTNAVIYRIHHLMTGLMRVWKNRWHSSLPIGQSKCFVWIHVTTCAVVYKHLTSKGLNLQPEAEENVSNTVYNMKKKNLKKLPVALKLLYGQKKMKTAKNTSRCKTHYWGIGTIFLCKTETNSLQQCDGNKSNIFIAPRNRPLPKNPVGQISGQKGKNDVGSWSSNQDDGCVMLQQQKCCRSKLQLSWWNRNNRRGVKKVCPPAHSLWWR